MAANSASSTVNGRASPVSDADSLDFILLRPNRAVRASTDIFPTPIMHHRKVPVHTVADDTDDEVDVKPMSNSDVKPSLGAAARKRKAPSIETLSEFNSEDERMLEDILTARDPVTPPRNSTSAIPPHFLPTPPSSSPFGSSSSSPTKAPCSSAQSPTKRCKPSTASPTPSGKAGSKAFKSGTFAQHEDLAIFQHFRTGAPWSDLAKKLNRDTRAVATRSKLVITKCEVALCKGTKELGFTTDLDVGLDI